MNEVPFHLPSPPTLEQRLDAAAKAFRSKVFHWSDELAWEDIGPEAQRSYLERTEFICRAFAPEYFKDTDTTTGKD